MKSHTALTAFYYQNEHTFKQSLKEIPSYFLWAESSIVRWEEPWQHILSNSAGLLYKTS